MKSLFKKAIALSFAILVGFTGIVNAASYSDLGGYKWAEPYVYDMSTKGIISGYPNGTFKPANSVTRIEAIVMVTRLHEESDINTTYSNYKDKYIPEFQKLRIDTWSWPYLVYAFENSILPLANGKVLSREYNNYFVSSTNPLDQKKAGRYEIPVFLVRALNLENEIVSNPSLPYKDANSIQNSNSIKASAGFIDVLLKKGVLSPTGDGHGFFNPLKTVTRAEMATMLSRSYKFSPKALGQSTLPTTPTTTPTPVNNNLLEIQGKISLITNLADGQMTISLQQGNGTTSNFSGDRNAMRIFKGSNEISYSRLEVGDEVKLTFTNGKITRVHVKETNEIVKGVIDSVSTSEKTLLIDVSGQLYRYKYADNVKVNINNSSSTIDKLVKGAAATLTIDSQKQITQIDAQITKKDVKGTLERIDERYAEIKEGSSDIQRYEFASNVRFYQNGNRVDKVAELATGSDVIANLEDGKIIRLEVTTKQNKYLDATIDGISVSSNTSTITIKDRDNKTYTFTVNSSTTIELNRNRATLSDLKVGYIVDVYTDGNNAKEIDSRGNYQTTTVSGTIVDVGRDYITIEDRDRKTQRIYYTSTTKIENLRTGATLTDRDMFKNDGVTAIGILKGNDLEAQRIMVDIRG